MVLLLSGIIHPVNWHSQDFCLIAGHNISKKHTYVSYYIREYKKPLPGGFFHLMFLFWRGQKIVISVLFQWL